MKSRESGKSILVNVENEKSGGSSGTGRNLRREFFTIIACSFVRRSALLFYSAAVEKR